MAVLKSPPAAAIFSPISEQKEPSSIRGFQVFPGHPGLGAGQGRAGSKGREGIASTRLAKQLPEEGKNSDTREQTQN